MYFLKLNWRHWLEQTTLFPPCLDDGSSDLANTRSVVPGHDRLQLVVNHCDVYHIGLVTHQHFRATAATYTFGAAIKGALVLELRSHILSFIALVQRSCVNQIMKSSLCIVTN